MVHSKPQESESCEESDSLALFGMSETQIPPEQVNRFQAGAAMWKILCPPACRVDCFTKRRRHYSFWSNRGTLSRWSCTAQSSQTSFARDVAPSDSIHSNGMGCDFTCSAAADTSFFSRYSVSCESFVKAGTIVAGVR